MEQGAWSNKNKRTFEQTNIEVRSISETLEL
jgi:hypothetical protein